MKTFVPPGGRDEYLLFASGGHSGQVHVVGVPSMRLLKTIAVFTPEPWQGYGYGADWSEHGACRRRQIRPRPARERQRRMGTATGTGTPRRIRCAGAMRITRRSARPPASTTAAGSTSTTAPMAGSAWSTSSDFRAKQILQVPNLQTSHGGVFATPEPQYVHISSKVPALKASNASQGQTSRSTTT